MLPKTPLTRLPPLITTSVKPVQRNLLRQALPPPSVSLAGVAAFASKSPQVMACIVMPLVVGVGLVYHGVRGLVGRLEESEAL